MRYVVTGAAGFIGSHAPAHASRARARRRRLGRVHRLLRPGAEGGERARTARRARRPRRGRARPRRRRRRLPPRGSAGCRELRRRVPGLRSPERARQPAAVRGCGAPRASERCSLRRPRSTATPRAYPTPESASPQPLSPYGITKLACEQLATAYAQEFGLDAVTVRYFTIYGPRQRPDMAFTKMVTCLAEGGTVRAARGRNAVSELHLRRRRRGGDDRGDGAGTDGVGLQRRRRHRGLDARRHRGAGRGSPGVGSRSFAGRSELATRPGRPRTSP